MIVRNQVISLCKNEFSHEKAYFSVLCLNKKSRKNTEYLRGVMGLWVRFKKCIFRSIEVAVSLNDLKQVNFNIPNY